MYSTVIIDIEGTVCSISFVKDKLFPYFLRRIPALLDALHYPLYAASQPTAEAQAIADVAAQFPSAVTQSRTALELHITQLVSNDVKDPVLKLLQGVVWQLGYDNGDLRAPVYADAIRLIKAYGADASKHIYVYSSGSVRAQKLLFGHVEAPSDDAGTATGAVDLNPNFDGYFDITTSGHKQEALSYTNILRSIGKSDAAETVLFLSDNTKEIEAALAAGLVAIVVERPGNAPLSSDERATYEVISNFDHLV
jgi:enolase-phosphatase E1